MRSRELIAGILGTLFIGAMLVQSVQGAMNNKPPINTLAGIIGSTAIAVNSNIITPTVGTAHNVTSSNNVTAASGNNGHIYRGAAAGSGGE